MFKRHNSYQGRHRHHGYHSHPVIKAIMIPTNIAVMEAIIRIRVSAINITAIQAIVDIITIEKISDIMDVTDTLAFTNSQSNIKIRSGSRTFHEVGSGSGINSSGAKHRFQVSFL
jgi:hypothetical protein